MGNGKGINIVKVKICMCETWFNNWAYVQTGKRGNSSETSQLYLVMALFDKNYNTYHVC